MRFYGLIVSCLLSANVWAQQPADTSDKNPPAKGTLSFEGYIDVYYSYALSHPQGGTRPYFFNYTRDNEFNIDIAYASLKYDAERVRAKFTPGFGTYMNANYASERQTLQNIIEAYIGVKLFKKKDIWLDAGVINSPYSNESPISIDQLTYTRSFGPEYVPYYQTGAKLSLPLTSKLELYLYLLNGWQVIQSQHDPLDFGSQLEYKPNGNWDINWNTYAGNENSMTHPNYRTRYFTDLYATYTPDNHWTIGADAYIGWQQRAEDSVEKVRSWWNLNLSARYNFDRYNSISGRIEYFNDPYSILAVPVTNVSGFKCASTSLGYNLAITDNVYFRVEARYFKSPLYIYPLRSGENTNQDLWFTGGLTARFR